MFRKALSHPVTRTTRVIVRRTVIVCAVMLAKKILRIVAAAIPTMIALARCSKSPTKFPDPQGRKT